MAEGRYMGGYSPESCLLLCVQNVVAEIEKYAPSRFQVEAAKAITRKEKGHIVILSPFGSGKTIAYAHPLVALIGKKLAQEPRNNSSFPEAAPCKPRLIVLTASRLACFQVHNVFQQLTKAPSALHNRVTKALTGQKSIGFDAEILVGMQAGIHTLVDDGKLTLENLEWLVIDEPSSLLSWHNLDREPDLELLRARPGRRSAASTMEEQISRITVLGAPLPRKCRFVLVGASTFDNDDTVKSTPWSRELRFELADMEGWSRFHACRLQLSWSQFRRDEGRLHYLVGDLHGTNKTAIFPQERIGATVVWCNTSKEVKTVASHLKKFRTLSVLTLGGEETREDRTTTADFIGITAPHHMTVLIATNQATCGGDLSMFANVINWGVPMTYESFVWRASRVSKRKDAIVHTYVTSPFMDGDRTWSKIMAEFERELEFQVPAVRSRRVTQSARSPIVHLKLGIRGLVWETEWRYLAPGKI